MVRNRISNDMDFMRPTQYIVPKNQVAKKPLSEPEALPPFSPLLFKTLVMRQNNLPPVHTLQTCGG